MTVVLPPTSPVWQRIRRYAVPGPMIAAATERREAGDWRGACTAAEVDIDESVTRVADTFGREAADRIGADLAALAPDLLRWYLPRAVDGRTSLATWPACQLSTAPGRVDAGTPMLTVGLPLTADGSQRLRLSVRHHDPALIDLPPAVWSAPHVDGLRDLYGGSEARMPRFGADGTPLASWPAPDPEGDDPAQRTETVLRALHEGRVADAWRLAGFEFDDETLVPAPEGDTIRAMVEWPEMRWISPVAMAAQLPRLRDRYGDTIAVVRCRRVKMVYLHPAAGAGPRLTEHLHSRVGARSRLIEDLLGDGDTPTVRLYLPPPDLDLVWHGLIHHEDLHPLVAGALFPKRPAAPSTAGVWPPAGTVLAPARVRCGGEWHTITHAGTLVPSHPTTENRREAMLRGLGGTSTGCYAAVQAWREGAGQLPKALAVVQREVQQRLQHGGARALLDLLDAGLDPHLRDARGRTLLHRLGPVDPTEVLPRLLAAGVPVDARDEKGRTPLYVIIGGGGPPELVRALIAAGADPEASDDRGVTPLDLADDKVSRWEMYDDEPAPPELVEVKEVLDDWARRERRAARGGR